MDLAIDPPALLIASNGKQIFGNHTPAHVALKSRVCFVPGSQHREGMLQGADGSLTAGSPAQRSPEPALRSEEHTSELQSHSDLVCRLLLEKKKKKTKSN